MKHILGPGLALWLLSALSMAASPPQGCTLERVTKGYAGGLANGDCSSPRLSFDGRFVGFSSSASNLVPGDTNGNPDSFVVDRQAGLTERISVTSAGVEGNGRSVGAYMTPDGRYVAFLSEATNLDPRDTDPFLDVYLRDRVTGTTTLVSERLGPGPSLKGCGGPLGISSDGRYVAFTCLDNNVLPGLPPSNSRVYVRDTVAQTTELVSIGPAGELDDLGSTSPAMSGDGRLVAFTSGSVAWFPSGPFSFGGIYLRDRLLGTTIAVTLTPAGILANGTSYLSDFTADGRYLVFQSSATDLLPPSQYFCCENVVRWDRLTGAFLNVSRHVKGQPATTLSGLPAISDDGLYVTLYTQSPDFTVEGGLGPFGVRMDTVSWAPKLLGTNAAGEAANAGVFGPTISGDGRVTAFVSQATNLLPGNSGFVLDVYVRECAVATPSVYCKSNVGPTGCRALLSFQGTPSASAGSGFDVRADGLEAQQVGLAFYGTRGPWGAALPGGYVCVRPPPRRTLAARTGGTSGCDGSLALDFNAWVAASADPDLVAGRPVHLQAWFRNGTGAGQLSDAIALVLGP